jgi:chromosome segregation ATPase
VVEAWDGGDDGHFSGEVRVRGKERELVAAREELRRRGDGEAKDAEAAEREKARDKDRIRALEEEIERLKQEVGRFYSHFSLLLNRLCSYCDDLRLHRSHTHLRPLRLRHLPFVSDPQTAQE